MTCHLSCPELVFNETGGSLIDTKVTGGYFSTPGNGVRALDDMTGYKFSLCEWCLDWLFQQFKIPVEISDDYVTDVSEAFRPAEQRVKEDSWRCQKEQFFLEYEKRNSGRNLKK